MQHSILFFFFLRLLILQVYTVDAFQGQEAAVVLFSLVKDGKDGIGFLGNKNRNNVMLIRSKGGLYILCNKRLSADRTNGAHTLVGYLAKDVGAW